VAFLGPSLPAAEALRILPEVELCPPICQGDLSTVVERLHPRAVLIVDGEFSQSLSVWHKEILHALHLGIRVLGASSMGALRAAELDRFGMEGVGAIYEYYRDGWLTADADVAVLHADVGEDYRPVTWPLVNVRATVQALQDEGRLTTQDGAATVAAAEHLHFTERSQRTMARQLVAEGMAATHADELAGLLATGYIDQKALDAIAGFEYLADLDRIPQPVGEVPLHRAGCGFQPLLWSDVAIRRSAGSLRRYQLVADVILHHQDFDGLMERAANRYLVSMLAHDMGAEVSPAEVEEQRARILTRLGLTESSLADWLVANDLDEPRFEALVEQEALNNRMRRWLLATRLLERNRRLVIEQLQLEGEYAAAADAAARRRAMADCRPTPPHPTSDDELRDLVIRQMAVSDWKPRQDIAKAADDQGFDTLASLMVALSDSAAAHIELQERRQRVAKALGLDGNGAGAQPVRSRPTPGARTHALLEAHQVTQVLLTALELDLPEALASGARSASDLAAATRTDVLRLERLLQALQAAGIVVAEEGRWALTPEGHALVSAGPAGAEGLAVHGELVRTDIFSVWARLADIIRGADPPVYPVDELSDRAIGAASRALGLTDIVIDAIELPKAAHVADIGGGLGELTQALLERRPDLKLSLVELPATARRAAARLRRTDGRVPIEVIPYVGQQRLTPPADRCLLTRVILTLDDSTALELLRFAGRSLSADGRLEIVDLEADGTPPTAFADLLSLARSGGAVRSPAQWHELARGAGLRITGRRSLSGPFVLLSMEREPAVISAPPESSAAPAEHSSISP
jgi:hypothetical protein